MTPRSNIRTPTKPSSTSKDKVERDAKKADKKAAAKVKSDAKQSEEDASATISAAAGSKSKKIPPSSDVFEASADDYVLKIMHGDVEIGSLPLKKTVFGTGSYGWSAQSRLPLPVGEEEYDSQFTANCVVLKSKPKKGKGSMSKTKSDAGEEDEADE